MDKQLIQRFKTLLEVRQHELRLSIDQQKQYERRAEQEPDSVDQSANIAENELSLRRNNKDRALLRMIESALGRIRDGNFGQCQSCGREIDVKRLTAVPWAGNCIQCQEDFER